MAFTKALYYPSIEIRDENWLKTAILFWDTISTIVPLIDNRRPYLTYSNQYLEDNGILEPFFVNSDMNIVRDLSDEAIKYITSTEAVELFRTDCFAQDLYEIHPNKLPQEVRRHLQEILHLYQYPDFIVGRDFGMYYMTLLANKICETEGFALLTDSPLAIRLADKAKLGDSQPNSLDKGNVNQSFRKEQMQRLGQGLLIDMIVDGLKISPVTPIQGIVEFKKIASNRDALGQFRSKVGDLSKAIMVETDMKIVRQKVSDVYNDDFLPAYRNLQAALTGAKIKWTTDNFLKIGFFSTSATAIPAVLLGATIPQALFAGAALSLVVSAISYTQDKKEKLRNSPYSYLMRIQEAL